VRICAFIFHIQSGNNAEAYFFAFHGRITKGNGMIETNVTTGTMIFAQAEHSISKRRVFNKVSRGNLRNLQWKNNTVVFFPTRIIRLLEIKGLITI